MRHLLIGFTCVFAPMAAAGSTCYGTVAHGRIEQGVQLPQSGVNFTAYSSLGVSLGRTYVHSAVSEVVLEAYRLLEQAAPRKHFVYGETGRAEGGAFPPHKTHQAGLSVDFMVPVLNKAGASVPLPATAANKYGYGIEFNSVGVYGQFTIDYEAMAEHLYLLSQAAGQHKVGIARVIFDPVLTEKLLGTARGPYLRQHLPFMKERPWIRHDEHYHVDFALPCRPNAKKP